MVIPKLTTDKSLMNRLSEEQLKRFRSAFESEDACMELLGNIKWENGFVCSKCGNKNSCRGKSKFSKRCTKCKKEESVTAQTLFHRCKIPLNKAFEIAFLACNFPAISSYDLSRKSEMRHMTCYKFQKKVQNCKENVEDDQLFSRLITEVNKQIFDTN